MRGNKYLEINGTIVDNVDFSVKDQITKVTIPRGITEIGTAAFSYCTNLQVVRLPKTVKKIGWLAFESCSALEEIIIPNSVTEIEGSAFANCTSLKKIVIPKSVKIIGSSAFAGCSSLLEISIPNSVTEIGQSAFARCSSLLEISILNSEIDFGTSVFDGCISLKTIIVEKDINIAAWDLPENVKLIRLGVDKSKVEIVKEKSTKSAQTTESLKKNNLAQPIINNLSKIKFLDNILKARQKRLEQKCLRKERELKRQEEEIKLPGITKLKNYGFIDIDPNLSLTPLKVNQDRWFVNQIKPFEIIQRYIQNDILILRCKLKGIPSELDLSIYKEGIVLQGSYILPFQSSVICNITREYYNDMIYHCDGFPEDFVTIYDKPWEHQFYCAVEDFYASYDRTKYTKTGKVDRRTSEANRGWRTTSDRSYIRYKVSHTYTISLDKEWKIYFTSKADVNILYDFFKDVYNFTGRVLPALDEFIIEHNKPTDHNIVEFLSPEDRKKCYNIVNENLSAHGCNAEIVREEKLVALLNAISRRKDKELGVDYSDCIKEGNVKVGMRTIDCERAWGKPVSTNIRNQSKSCNGVYEYIKYLEIWEYPGGRRLHFENGKLTKIEN